LYDLNWSYVYFMKLIFWDWLGTLVSSDYLLNYYLKEAQDPISEKEFYEYKKEMLENNWVGYLPYAWQLVEKFNEAGVKQVVATNSSKSQLEDELKGAPFTKFDELLTVSEFNPKPDTQMFEYALAKYGCKSEDAIFIGDSNSDAIAANKSSIEFCSVDSGLLGYFKIARKFNFNL